MCIRLDCSEQGVCPRTCLSTRPLKPRSPSASSSIRPGTQMMQGNQNSKEFAPLPMLPIAQLGSGQRSPPVSSPGNITVKSNDVAITSKNKGNETQSPTVCHEQQLPSVIPLKNAARYVSLTLPKFDGPVPHSIPELSGSPAPVDDYFSFSKPTVESVIKDVDNGQTPSPSSPSIGGGIGIPAEFLVQKPTPLKPVPGQAL